MCKLARALITDYLNALEDYDRLYLIALAACRKGDRMSSAAFQELLSAAKSKYHSARERFEGHKEAHQCFGEARATAREMELAADG